MQSLCSGVVSFIDSPPARAPVTVSVFYPLTQVGKRRGGVFLKTGIVEKKKKQDTDVSGRCNGLSRVLQTCTDTHFCLLSSRLMQARATLG